MRIALCDDNPLQLKMEQKVIANILRRHNPRTELKTYQSGEELLQNVQKTGPFDIYLMDLLMPGLDGMEVAQRLRECGDKGQIVFFSFSREYALQSYEVGAAYYLLKPFDSDKLESVLRRSIHRAKFV